MKGPEDISEEASQPVLFVRHCTSELLHEAGGLAVADGSLCETNSL